MKRGTELVYPTTTPVYLESSKIHAAYKTLPEALRREVER